MAAGVGGEEDYVFLGNSSPAAQRPQDRIPQFHLQPEALQPSPGVGQAGDGVVDASVAVIVVVHQHQLIINIW